MSKQYLQVGMDMFMYQTFKICFWRGVCSLQRPLAPIIATCNQSNAQASINPGLRLCSRVGGMEGARHRALYLTCDYSYRRFLDNDNTPAYRL